MSEVTRYHTRPPCDVSDAPPLCKIVYRGTSLIKNTPLLGTSLIRNTPLLGPSVDAGARGCMRVWGVRWRRRCGVGCVGFGVQGLWFGVEGLGFWVQGTGFRISNRGSGFKVVSLGFCVQGSGFRV